MSAVEILKAIAAQSTHGVEGALPPRVVRFVLEYAARPSVSGQKARIIQFLGADNFQLETLHPDLAQFLVLQFPGVPRTISTPTLYAAADSFANELALVSCVPDTGVTFVEEVRPGDLTGESAVGDAVLDLTCWAKEDPALPLDWPLKNIRADKAWTRTKGAEIIVGQPDTGVASHSELEEGALDLAKAKNILTNTADATDPLRSDMASPGHGTATSSVITSRLVGKLTGVAPEARVVPIRCIDSVILGIDGAPIAKAILHAKTIGADVITMSLGGAFYSPAIAAAVEQAVDAGIIVLAAAGNCVHVIVVYPANDPNVIAVGGTNRKDDPWKGTSQGPKVDVSAPAENVFVARREPNQPALGKIAPSQGTSYATALTAGVAALWLAHHKRQVVRKEASTRGVTVNELFRWAVCATARKPAHWDARGFMLGAGIVDADKLLEMPLHDIPRPAAMREVASAAANPQDAVNEVLQLAAARRSDDGFDWRRHGAEAVYLATDALWRTDTRRSVLVESNRKPQATPELAMTMPAVLRIALSQAVDAPVVMPPSVAAASTLNGIRILGSDGRVGNESSGSISIEKAKQNLANGGLKRLQDLAEKVFRGLDVQDGDDRSREERRRVLESTERVVKKLVGGDSVTELTPPDRLAYEALVKLKERPALRIVNGTVDIEDPLFGEWGGDFIALEQMPKLTGAVGRINLDGTHIGTGFVIGDGLIMTNRHVLEGIAEEVRGASGVTWHFELGDPTIDFSDVGDGTSSFKIKSVVAAGPDRTNSLVNFGLLDMAILDVETKSEAGHPLPRKVRLVGTPNVTSQKIEMFAVGYPARPGTKAMLDPNTGKFSHDIASRLAQIFNVQYGRKYLSPGQIEQVVGAIPSDKKSWVFAHDATTLGGNSGSYIAQFGDLLGVVGLHFGGAPLTANYAHSLAKVRAANILPALTRADIDWV